MLDKLTPSTTCLPRVWSRVSLQGLLWILALTAPVLAEPVVNGPAQPANRLIDASPWLPDAQNPPAQAPFVLAPSTHRNATASESTRPAAVNSLPDLSRPPTAAPTQDASKTRADPTAAKARDDAPPNDVRSAVKETVRPLYEELNSSDAAQALRSLQSELSLDKDQVTSGADTTLTSRPDGSNPALNAPGWEGQPNREAPRTAAQVERDKVLASVLMDKLIDEVMPWAIGLAALYALYYLVKLALAYGRHRSNRRRQGSMRRRSRSNPST